MSVESARRNGPPRDRSADEYVPHGRPSGYSYWKCRCKECTEAQAFYKKSWKIRVASEVTPLEQHGKASTYFDRGCRCDRCKHAQSEYSKAYRKARRK